MTSARRALIGELFDQIIDHPPSEYRSLVEAACREDQKLADELIALLNASADGDHKALRHPLAGIANELLTSENVPDVPRLFGRYRVTEFLGQGGMGSVYVAEREGLQDKVAIKFLHDPWSSPVRRQRFIQEQRTLAALNHPHIARLYDAGVENEIPWFAMEYVAGWPINVYCRNNSLGLRQRLILFSAVCQAVSYAHRNLTLHLDLKPSNILVTESGNVKLLDFGIAKSVDRNGVEVEKTRTGLRLFSLNYAAPEQIRGELLDIQTDIHGLGVILYDLLTGGPPVDLSTFSMAELLRFTEVEVQRPSAASLQGGLVAIQASKSDWDDLDVLCQTALHRDRGRRYQSAEALIRDLNHFLNDEPIEARTDSLTYRIRKFADRNQRGVISAAIVVTTIVLLSLAFTIRLVEARNRALSSEAQTQRINQLMLNLFEGDDSEAGPSEGLRVVQLLDRGAKQAESLKGEPAVQQQLEYVMGGLYQRLGHLDRAETLLRSAVTGQLKRLGSTHPDVIKSQLALALILADESKFDEGDRLVQQALTSAQSRYAKDSKEVANARAARAALLADRGYYNQALPIFKEAISVLTNGPETAELSEALGGLANTYYSLGLVGSSEEVNKRALAVDQKLFGPNHPFVGVDLFNLGNIYLDRGEYAQGELLFRQVVDIYRTWYGEVHPKTASGFTMLGRSLSYQGRLAEANDYYSQALAAAKASHGENTPRYAVILSLMGDLAREVKEFDKANMLFRQARDIFKRTLGENHEFYFHQLSNLGSVYIAQKRYHEAEVLLQTAVHSLQLVVPDQRYTGIAQVRLGAALAGQRRYREAEVQALAGYVTLQKQTSSPTAELQSARKLLFEIYTVSKQPLKANQFK